MSIGPIIVGADDYGFAPGVSEAIRQLIEAGRLTATSCMTGSPLWPEEAKRLLPLADSADIGVHLTLTDHKPLGAMPDTTTNGLLPSFNTLFKRSLRRKLDADEIHAELDRQVTAFCEAFGRPPDYLDGHHHVQQLPVIRDQVLRVYRERVAPTGGYLRSCFERFSTIRRRGVDVARTTSFAWVGIPLRRRALATDVPINTGFSGVYDFTDSVPYGQLFERFLIDARPRMFLMCHPGFVDDTLERLDSLTDQRKREFDFLLSDECGGALERAGVRLGRFA